MFLSVSLASVAIGRSASLGHDLGKAKIAVTKIFQLIDRKSQIDPSSEQGIRPVRTGFITMYCILLTPVFYVHIYILEESKSVVV